MSGEMTEDVASQISGDAHKGDVEQPGAERVHEAAGACVSAKRDRHAGPARKLAGEIGDETGQHTFSVSRKERHGPDAHAQLARGRQLQRNRHAYSQSVGRCWPNHPELTIPN